VSSCVGWGGAPSVPIETRHATCNCLFLQSQRSITLEREISNRKRRRRKATHIHRGRQTDKRFRQIHMYKNSRLLLLLLRFCSIEKKGIWKGKNGATAAAAAAAPRVAVRGSSVEWAVSNFAPGSSFD